MRAQGPTSYFLDEANLSNLPNALQTTQVSGGAAGLRLSDSADPDSPNSLQCSDGSLGGLVLPLGMAVDDAKRIYLLAKGGTWVQRYDARSRSFVRIAGIGGPGAEAREFRQPANIAIAGPNLYVADAGNRRVQVFRLETLALVHVWGPFDGPDVCAAAGDAYILDAARGQVYRHCYGMDRPTRMVNSPENAGKWSRIVADRHGQVYLLDDAKIELSVFDAAGAPQPPATDAETVRDLFPKPLVRANHQGLFRLPDHSTFDLTGRPARMDPAAPLGPRLYQTNGAWVSNALDSEIYHCSWHRIELEADVPSGTLVRVSTYTNESAADESVDGGREQRIADIGAVKNGWETKFSCVGQLQTGDNASVSTEFLILSAEGRYLWLRIELESDGYATPLVRRLRVHYPRESYLQYLPAVYSADPEGRRFLERFLAVFKTEWDDLERQTAEMARYFDPKAVPAGPFLDWLASWLALPLEQTWSPEQNRKLLKAAPKFYPRIGTPDGLGAYLRVYFENAGAPVMAGYPRIVEGFRVRRQMVSLGTTALGREGSGAPLWSSQTVGRLQLGEFARVGEARLVSPGNPESDFFSQYAHRFQVLAPASWVKTADQEAMVRRALDAAKPAQTSYDLRLVEPRFRIGVQSTVGLDTILGAVPAARLTCVEAESAAPPSRPPRNRLGYDTVLAPSGLADAGFRLSRRGARAGIETILR